MVVDVGGNQGHDLDKMREKHPDLPDGSLALQDLEGTLKSVVVRSPIRAMTYDFFTPEPVKGMHDAFQEN